AKLRLRPRHRRIGERPATSSGRPFLKKLSLLGIVIGAALLTAAPISVQPSSKSVVQLSLNKADAQYRVYRRPYRRAYRRAPSYGYGYGYPTYPTYPTYSTSSYGLYPTAFGRGYRVVPWWDTP